MFYKPTNQDIRGEKAGWNHIWKPWTSNSFIFLTGVLLSSGSIIKVSRYW